MPGAHPAGRAGSRTCPGSTPSRWRTRLPADDVVLTMIQDGDHRLSRPQDIARIMAAVAEMG